MIFKRLEMTGFKSFAQKTTLDFPAGVTAIVGPNGSGKSNVIDAIKWLLGERDAKHLRGGKSEDLIFAGTAQKNKTSMAAAALYFDNSSRFFAYDFDEIEIRREIYRDGTAKYFLNKSEARLKDLVEVLSRSRLGTKGLIVIGQGNSDLFIKATPLERRDMIEEILGLREFRIKKAEAERKLTAAGENAIKIKGLIDEIEPHLSFLKKQTAKWEKREEVESELFNLEKEYYGFRRGWLEREMFAIDPKIDEMDRKIGIERKKLAEMEKDLTEVEGVEPEKREEQKQLSKERNRLMEERGRIEREMAFLEARMEIGNEMREGRGGEGSKEEARIALSISETVKVLSSLRDSARSVLDSATLEEVKVFLKEFIEEAGRILSGDKEENKGKNLSNQNKAGVDFLQREEKERDGAAKKIEEVRDKLAEINKNIEKLGIKEEEISSYLGRFTSIFKEAMIRVENKKEEMARLEREKERFKLDKERALFKLEDLKQDMTEVGLKYEDFPAVVGDNKEENEINDDVLSGMNRKIVRLRNELAAIGEVDKAILTEATETEERYNFLNSQLADLEAAAVDAREMVEDLARTIHLEFNAALDSINKELQVMLERIFNGGTAKLELIAKSSPVNVEEEEVEVSSEEGSLTEPDFKESKDIERGVDLKVKLPKKKVSGLESLSGGERSLVSIAALFSLISVSPPPFLVLDEVDAPLDERNAIRFAEMVKSFSEKVQFIVVTHNRATMEAADVLYGVTLGDDGASRVVSLKLNK